MNRKQRRAQNKAGSPAGPARRGPPAAMPRAASVSDMLLGLGGVRTAPVPATPAAAAAVDPVHAALAQLRLGDGLAIELARREAALKASPDSLPLLHSVARLQLRLDRRADALVTFGRILALAPGDAEAAHMAAVLAGTLPDKADAGYVAALFDGFADSFDAKLTQWLDYRAPEQVATAAAAALGGMMADRAIDLGCGTGLLGPLVRGFSRRLEGIDLSPRMIEKARDRGYDQLEVAEIVAHLEARAQAYDIAYAADVLSYLGDLRPVLAALHGALRPGGCFVATVEQGSGARYQASRTGRYQHGEAYLRKRAAEAGFAVEQLAPVELRREENRPVMGYLFVLRWQPLDAAPESLVAVSTGDLLASLDAPTADAVLAAAQRMIGADFAVGWALDLGGGMARHAAGLRLLAQHLDMVTPDAARCRRAFEAGVYDDCDTGEAVAFLEARPDHFDLILLPGLLPPATDLPAFFAAVKIALAVAGVFVGVLAAPPAGLQAMAQAEGLVVLAAEPVALPDGTAACCLILES